MVDKATSAALLVIDTSTEYCTGSAVDLKVIGNISLRPIRVNFHIDSASTVIYTNS